MMKSFKEYLFESKKTYAFKVKVAGDLPENFKEGLKARLARCGAQTIEESGKTPIQALPVDFPELKNVEVHIFNVMCEYPVTAPEIAKELTEMGMDPCCFRVRGAGEPSEEEQMQATAEASGKSFLEDGNYSEAPKVKHKEYFGNDFNSSFLKDLNKAAKERAKEEGKGEYKLPKAKQDKAGAKSAIGS